MTLFRNIIMALVAFVVLGMAAPAFAKTNAETVACRDAGFAALPFTGTPAEKEAYAKTLPIGTEVLVDGITVPLAEGQSLWSRCKTGPTELEVASARIRTLEARVNTLRGEKADLLEAINGKGGWREHLATAEKTIETRDATIKAAQGADFWQFLLIGLLLFAGLVACFRNTIGDKLEDLDMALGRWLDMRAAAKARKNAPADPIDTGSAGSDDGDEFP